MYSNPQELCAHLVRQDNRVAMTYINVDTADTSSITYSQLLKYIYKGNAFFKKSQSSKTPTIAFLFENCPEVVVLNLLSLCAGLRSCPIDTKRDTPEVIIKKLQQTECRILFYRKSPHYEKLVNEITKHIPLLQSYALENAEDLNTVFGEISDDVFEGFNPENVSLVLYTSGTTGFPKGTMLTYNNLMAGAAQVGEWFQITPEDNFYLVLPLHHINSTVFALATLFAGGSLTIASRYSKTKFFEHLSVYDITMSSIVPTINLDLLEQEESFNKVKNRLRVKRIQIGSAPVSAHNTMAFVAKYNIQLIQGYGSTETSLRVTGVPVNLDSATYNVLLSENSIGVPLSKNTVKLVDKNGHEVTDELAQGELVVSGPNVMKGYLDRLDETKEALRGNDFFTGDVGYFKNINGTKYYFINGRIKEIIIKGGVNISPVFIEEKIRPLIKWAREVVVVGFPHRRFGEELGVVVIPKFEEYTEELHSTRSQLRKKQVGALSAYDTPQAVVVASWEDIAKTATGKIQHTKVRDAFSKKLRDDFLYIGENNVAAYRIVEADEELTLFEMMKIHNDVFGAPLQMDMPTLIHRATSGFVIGAFDKLTHRPVGMLTGFFGNESLSNHNKWTDITGSGLFTTANPKGNTAYLCSAASISSSGKKISSAVEPALREVSYDEVKEYIDSEKDFTVRFHYMPKAGFVKGAAVRSVILHGNDSDIESRGIVVLFEYPPLTARAPIFTADKIGVGLIESALLFAWENNKEKAIAVSRLGEAHKHIPN